MRDLLPVVGAVVFIGGAAVLVGVAGTGAGEERALADVRRWQRSQS